MGKKVLGRSLPKLYVKAVFFIVKMTAELKQIEEEVLARVKPKGPKKQEIEEVSKELIEVVDQHFTELEKPRLVGSISKETYLVDPDIDVFVKFNPSTSKEKMEKKVLKVGRKILDDTEERYAEHPYIHGRFHGLKVDIVPCYDIDDIEEMKSAVDRTPFHTDHIKENMSPEQKDEARLFKAYLKGIGAYGAEAKVWGFSGYLCELLILHHGSFQNLLKDARDWRPGKKIEMVEGEKRFEDPLIVIDPVDPQRNVAAPVSMETFALFVLSAKRFLKHPELSFFFPGKLKIKDEKELSKKLEKRGSNFLGVSFPRPDIVEDNLYPQVQKCIKKLERQMIHKDFDVLHSDYFVKNEDILLLFETKQSGLTTVEKHRGPPVWVDNTEDFIEKYGNEAYIENERVWVDRYRENTELRDVLDKIMKELDLGSDLNPFLPEEVHYMGSKKLIAKEREPLSEFLDRSFPWER